MMGHETPNKPRGVTLSHPQRGAKINGGEKTPQLPTLNTLSSVRVDQPVERARMPLRDQGGNADLRVMDARTQEDKVPTVFRDGSHVLTL
ncbi:hypothetical protein C5167_004780 [Papaver somniferum]|uniref:Uncharacterized protein n=1 Tax=Papaver somniferum TaxID=3469 RepID=A0A4Y7J8L0_PAPSO|nr:hypothetical protein C5167_004780 [Papaver somniferum]